MTFDKLVGPATVVYLVSVSVAALWWASDLSTRVAQLEHSTVTAERIARLETEVHARARTFLRMPMPDIIDDAIDWGVRQFE